MEKERPLNLGAGDTLPLGSRIRLRRNTLGIRLAEMARDLAYNSGYLSRIENNRVRPSEECAESIAEYLGISVQELRESPIDQLCVVSAGGRYDDART